MREKEQILTVNGDILSLFKISREIGWGDLKEISIYRIIYISSVLYSFKFPTKENPFSKNYEFITSLRGPYAASIKDSINYLLAFEYIILDNDSSELKLVKGLPNAIEKTPDFLERYQWLETIIYILAIYGEEKIYDFVIRDPEYQRNIQVNSIKELNLNKGNETYMNLLKLKEAFETALGSDASLLSNKQYLEYYFEYIFSKILRGELDNEL